MINYIRDVIFLYSKGFRFKKAITLAKQLRSGR
jgi:hypothetical protein